MKRITEIISFHSPESVNLWLEANPDAQFLNCQPYNDGHGYDMVLLTVSIPEDFRPAAPDTGKCSIINGGNCERDNH